MLQGLASAIPSPGKRVGGSLYIHRAAITALEPSIRQLIEKAENIAGSVEWNVAKVGPRDVSLLLYEDFDEAAFPALLESTKVDLELTATKKMDYRGRASPPILHRKELLLTPDDPRIPTFAALTRSAEKHGLFAEPSTIGTRNRWLECVKAAGLQVHGQRLVPLGTAVIEVVRHRTALTRRELSLPFQLMIRLGIIDSSRNIFDYGCGQGDDIAALTSAGYNAFGWDPHYAATGSRQPADIVNLGYVLNVIENPEERAETLKAAWSFTRSALNVAVMYLGKSPIDGLRPYGDGYLTSWGTFQKYFGQQELFTFLQSTIGVSPVALAPGIFVLFRDKDLEQEVLLRRRSRRIYEPRMPRPPMRDREASTAPRVVDRIRSELQQIWQIALDRGRLPEAEEISAEIKARLAAEKVSVGRALATCVSEAGDPAELEAAGKQRREELLVHFALALFPGAPRYTTLPRSIQRDIKSFFRSHAAAQDEAKRFLFSAGDRIAVGRAVEDALQAELGELYQETRFRFHTSVLPRLPAVLRVLVGCAEVLQGGATGADFVDIDLSRPRLSMITCDDLEKLAPEMIERVHVDLSRLRVSTDRPVGKPLIYNGQRFWMD